MQQVEIDTTTSTYLKAAQLNIGAVDVQIALYFFLVCEPLQIRRLADGVLVGSQVKVVAHGEKEIRLHV
jgi:hypothetical protein